MKGTVTKDIIDALEPGSNEAQMTDRLGPPESRHDPAHNPVWPSEITGSSRHRRQPYTQLDEIWTYRDEVDTSKCYLVGVKVHVFVRYWPYLDLAESNRLSVIRRWGSVRGFEASIELEFASSGLDVTEKMSGDDLKCLNYPFVLQSLLAHVLKTRSDATTGIAQFRAFGGESVYCNLVDLMWRQYLHRGDTEVGTPFLVEAAYVGWLLGDFAKAMQVAQIAKARVSRDWLDTSPLWLDHARGVACTGTGEEYRPAKLAVRGADRHWHVYMVLLADVLARRPLDSALAAVDESFTRRNKDKRLYNLTPTDGSGQFPVRWDFRRHAILSLADQLSSKSNGIQPLPL